jgi:hypothetical protein
MTEPTAEERLSAQVDRILDAAAVHRRDRGDLAEELYGHLWQRWQEGVASGLSEDAAADAAIAGFGEADRLGRDMTLAYHSRLYASTVGVLLPTVANTGDKPSGYGRARVLLFLSGFFELLGGIVVMNGLTPLRMLVVVLTTILLLSMTLLAYRALALRQQWALAFLRVLTVAFIADFALELALKPITISFLGILAIPVVFAAFGQDLALWVGGSRHTGRVLGGLVVASVVLGFGTPQLVAAMPDPTQASPTDLSMVVRIDCTRSGGLVMNGTVTATIRWARTDFLPSGLGSSMSQTDQLGATSISSLGFDPNDPTASSFQFPRGGMTDGVVTTGMWAVVDSETGQTADAGVMMFSRPAFFTVGVQQDGIDPGSIRANRTYVASFDFVAQQPTGLTDDPVFRIRYDHQGRWGVEAFATCTKPGVGHPVTTREPPQTTQFP